MRVALLIMVMSFFFQPVHALAKKKQGVGVMMSGIILDEKCVKGYKTLTDYINMSFKAKYIHDMNTTPLEEMRSYKGPDSNSCNKDNCDKNYIYNLRDFHKEAFMKAINHFLFLHAALI